MSIIRVVVADQMGKIELSALTRNGLLEAKASAESLLEQINDRLETTE
jgi:hypothetical protein